MAKRKHNVAGVGKLTKDQIMTVISICLLLFTALMTWNIYSWIVLLAVIVLLFAWYFRA